MKGEHVGEGGKDRKKAVELTLPFSQHSRQQESRRSSLERERESESVKAARRQRRAGRALAFANLMRGHGQSVSLASTPCGLESWHFCSLADWPSGKLLEPPAPQFPHL